MFGPLPWGDTGTAETVVAGFADGVPGFTASDVVMLVVLAFGSKGGGSIRLPSVDSTWFTI
jgi:hypothetical protein